MTKDEAIEILNKSVSKNPRGQWGFLKKQATEVVENALKGCIEWHEYQKEKPKNNGRYLCVFSYDILDFGRFKDGEWYALDEVYGWVKVKSIKWWAELPDTPVCRRENAE